jgi:hypothetical protein
MSLEWLHLRISEEKDRREREARILERLPRALEEVYASLSACIEAYTQAFGPEAAQIRLEESRVVATVREQRQGGWEEISRVEISIAPKLPGFQVEGAGEPLPIEVGTLPGDRMFYKHRDKFLTLEDVTRRILDRALFPKLGE